MKILHGAELASAILKLFKEQGRLRCAVAFWGPDLGKVASKRQAEIVLDISMGGTSRNALKALGLRKKRLPLADGLVTVLDGLHAKIFVGERYAIVGSANASRRALGREGRGPSLHEAGVLFYRDEDQVGYGQLVDLYEHYRGLSRPITAKDIERAPSFATSPAARDFQDGSKSTAASLLAALLVAPERFSHTAFIFGDHQIKQKELIEAKDAYEDAVGEPPEAANRSHICSLDDDPETDAALRGSSYVFMYWFASPTGVSAYHDVVRIEHDDTVSYFGRLDWRVVRKAHDLPTTAKAETWRADSVVAEQIASSDGAKARKRFVALSSGDLFETLERDFAAKL